MNTAVRREAPLQWDVFVAKRKGVTRDLPPGKEDLDWVGGSATLIQGRNDAILVDTLLTIDQNRALVDWIATKGKNLLAIYITHGHADHFFGLGAILDRFPSAKALAVPNALEVMRRQASAESVANFWGPRYPGQIPDKLVIADALPGNVIELEDHELIAIELGHTDTDSTTCLHVPSVGLVVAGDAAYNDTHLYLAESNAQSRREWIAALDRIEALKPRAVVAGHKKPERSDTPAIVEETRQYIRDFERLAESTTTAHEFYDQMLGLYPNRANPGALWGATHAAKR
jgi:glyoxylase-like metal-dependent hydrolase (beta-lactamase superfamily II)